MSLKDGAAPTLEAVAERAGVSRATVSRVVNGSDKVNPDSVEAVRAAIEELGYVPNRAARSLVNQNSQAIALVVPENIERVFGDLHIGAVISGIHARLEQSDYVLTLMVDSDATGVKLRRYLAGGAADGVVVLSHHEQDPGLGPISSMMPVIYGGRPSRPDPAAYVVDVDNVAGAVTATKRLVSVGRRRIASVTGALSMQSGQERLEGWRTALADAGIEPGPHVDGEFTVSGGARAMRAILDQDPEVDGVFAASDQMATGAISVLLDRGYRVPNDVAVVGYDDSRAARDAEVPLTTVRQPSEEMGRAMAQLVLDILGGNAPSEREVIIPTALVERDSA